MPNHLRFDPLTGTLEQIEKKFIAEQALENLTIVYKNHFRGLENEHIIIQQSLYLIKSLLKKEDPQQELEPIKE